MKNIHILPTDKRTRLYFSDYGKELNLASHPATLYHTGQHLYITNDEEIKEGDYFLYNRIEIRFKTNGTEYHGGNLCHISGNRRYSVDKSKKIILTTDQDLMSKTCVHNFVNIINDGFQCTKCKKQVLRSKITVSDTIDGVQAIDDEFLEWFVKNPSCESIEVINDKKLSSKSIYDAVEGDLVYSHHGYGGIINNLSNDIRVGIDNYIETAITSETGWETLDINNYKIYDKCYKIIIPKEEPKDVVLGYKTCLDAQMLDRIDLEESKKENSIEAKQRAKNYMSLKGALEPKQETLEEAFRLFPRLINDPYNPMEDDNKQERDIWISGAKYQAERMYSEEDMRQAFIAGGNSLIEEDDDYGTEYHVYMEDWFKQFKKK